MVDRELRLWWDILECEGLFLKFYFNCMREYSFVLKIK